MAYFHYDSFPGPKIQTSAISLSPNVSSFEVQKSSSSSIMSPPPLPKKKNALKRGRSSPGQVLFSPDFRNIASKTSRVDEQKSVFLQMSTQAERKLSEINAEPILASHSSTNTPQISPAALFSLTENETSQPAESKDELKVRILPPRTNNFGIAFLSESDNHSTKSLPKASNGIRELSELKEFDRYFESGKKVEEDRWATSLQGKHNLYVTTVCLGVVIAAHATLNNEVIRTGMLDIVTIPQSEKILQHKIRSFLRNMQHTPGSQVSLFVAGGAGTNYQNNQPCRLLRKILSEQEFASRGTSVKSHLINPWKLNKSYEDEEIERIIDKHNVGLSIGIRKGDPMVVDNTTLVVDTVQENGTVSRSKMFRPENCNFADMSQITIEEL